MSNIKFENNNSKRTDSHGTFIDKPIRPKVDNGDIVTWADLIDWGEFDLTISSGVTPANGVENTYESFINALKLNFSHLLSRIQSLENGGSGTPEIVLISDISLNLSSIELTSQGATRTLSATVTPANATNQQLQWSSSNTSVATVSSSGKVKAEGTGSATITCKAKDGSNVQATCSVRCSWDDVVPVTQYTVTFNKNGGSSTAPASITCNEGDSITLPSYSGTKTRYKFTGWNTNSSGTGPTTYNVGASYTPSGNVTLYAKWEEDIITIKFVDSQFNNSVQNQTVYRGGTINILTPLSHEGYTFDGWYTSGGQHVTAGVTPIDPGTGVNIITLYARWTADTPAASLYWYIGITKPTSISEASVVSSYGDGEFVNPSMEEKNWVYILTNIDKTVDLYDPGFPTQPTQKTEDTTSIPGYKITTTYTRIAKGGSVLYKIS